MEFREWLELQQEFNFRKFAKGAAVGALAGSAALGGLKVATSSNPTSSNQPNIFTTNNVSDAPIVDVPKKKTPDTNIPTVTPKTQAPSNLEYFDYIKESEGYKTKVYDDGVGNLTIGVGHLITPNSKAIFHNLFGNAVNFDDVVSGKTSLTPEQVQTLFAYDVQKHLNRAKKRFPKFDSYPLYLRKALLDSVYRGDTGDVTTNLINQGKWREAAQEYLNRRDYQNRAELRIRGIGPRMERNRDAMLKYAEEIGQ